MIILKINCMEQKNLTGLHVSLVCTRDTTLICRREKDFCTYVAIFSCLFPEYLWQIANKLREIVVQQ